MKIDESEFKVEYKDNEVILIRYSGDKTKVEIPFGITIIGDEAFVDCQSLTEVNIPNSVTTIGDSAFHERNSLKEITLPNSVTTIGEGAFSDCKSLTKITLPNSVTTIGRGAFKGCSSLKEITIPNSVTTIGSWAFYWCTSLKDVAMSDSLVELGSEVFENCNKLKEIEIPFGIEILSDRSFYNCKLLKNIQLPNSIIEIGNDVFSRCEKLEELVLPSSVMRLGYQDFSKCYSLKNIVIHNSIREIDYNLFRDVPNLSKSIRIIYGEQELLNNLSPNLEVKKSYVFTYVNPNENNVVEEVPISWNVGFKGRSIDEVMTNFDKSYSNAKAEVKPLIAFFRVRSGYNLDDLTKQTYLRYLISKVDMVVDDLLMRENAHSLNILVDNGIINTRNVEKIIDRLLVNAEVEMTAILLNIKSKVKNDTLKNNKYRL